MTCEHMKSCFFLLFTSHVIFPLIVSSTLAIIFNHLPSFSLSCLLHCPPSHLSYHLFSPLSLFYLLFSQLCDLFYPLFYPLLCALICAQFSPLPYALSFPLWSSLCSLLCSLFSIGLSPSCLPSALCPVSFALLDSIFFFSAFLK